MEFISLNVDPTKDMIYSLTNGGGDPTPRTSEFGVSIVADALEQSVYFSQSAANAVTVDWGDNSTPDSPSDLSAVVSHIYAATGDYLIKITVSEGETLSLGKDSTVSFIGSTAETINYSLRSAVIKAADLNTYAFINCQGLASVTLPNSITSIPSSVFYGCTSLASVTIPDSVTSLGGSCFRDCSSLLSVTIPNSVTSVGSYCFAYCTSLLSVRVGIDMTTLGSRAFQGCTALMYFYCLPITPPTSSSALFSGITNHFSIYVPVESVDAYKTASPWSTRAEDIFPIT